MVKLHVKRMEQSQFLYETTTNVLLDDLVRDVTTIYNGRLKINRICKEMEELAKHGVSLPSETQASLPDVGTSSVQQRSGKAPSEKMVELLMRTVAEVLSAMSVESVAADVCLTVDRIHESLDMLRTTIAIVYPEGLPTDDPIRRELENKEDLMGTQAQMDVIDFESAQLWWAGKQLQRDKKLADFVGRNEKTKIIVKLQKMGQGPPSREPVVTEEQRKQLMLQAHHRQQELQRLDHDDDDGYLNSRWADQRTLKQSFHGVQNIQWKPR